MRRALVPTVAGALALAALVPLSSPSTAEPGDRTAPAGTHAARAALAAADGPSFARLATYPVFRNVPAGVPASDETVAEISDVSPDGNTLVYTDAAGGRAGFVDLSDPTSPEGLGSYAVEPSGTTGEGSPTSVAVVGAYVLVAVDETDDLTEPAGRLDVVRLRDARLVTSIDLGGQPDSIAIDDDESYAVIAIENQRDEDLAPPGGDEGDLPQPPAGFVQTLALDGAPTTWTAEPIELTDGGDPLPVLVEAGANTPEDPEPEYADFVPGGTTFALTLQENNAVVIADAATGEVSSAFSAGTVSLDGIDTDNDGLFDPTGSFTDLPREPDAIAWLDETHVATADEGDWLGGTRGWTVFDAATGEVVWAAGRTLEDLATEVGLHNDDRADNKGVEPEGLAVATYGDTTYAFVGSERSNFVAAYDVDDPTAPELVQVLPTTNGPEGLLPIPSRDLLVVSSETDDAEAGVRSTVSVHELGDEAAEFPQLLSARTVSGRPIGWGALGALAAHPRDPGTVYAASDAAYATGRIYEIDVTDDVARINGVTTVTDAGGDPVDDLDLEGLTALEGGGFWAVSEGATGADNALLVIAADGEVTGTVPLPTEVTDDLAQWGLEGVARTSDADGDEIAWVALQRELSVDGSTPGSDPVDPEGVVRIGRYDVAADSWSWFGYRLDEPRRGADWIGLSEIVAVDDDTLALIERDTANGPAARIKRITAVDVPLTAPDADLTLLEKRPVRDVLPDLRATNGWTQEKLEGLTIGADGTVYAVTDNDGLEDATGETVFLRLGRAIDLFRGSTRTSTGLTARSAEVAGGRPVVLDVDVDASGEVEGVDGLVRVREKGVVLAEGRVRDGEATLRVPLAPGRHRLRGFFVTDGRLGASQSPPVVVRVTR